jgi:uncharacterized protein YoxC
MNTLIHADVFFFITSIAVVIISIILIIALIYVVKIFRDIKKLTEIAKKEADLLVSKVRYISGKVERESDEMLEDIKQIRQNIKAGASLTSLPKVVGFISKFFWKGMKKKRSDADDEEEE